MNEEEAVFTNDKKAIQAIKIASNKIFFQKKSLTKSTPQRVDTSFK